MSTVPSPQHASSSLHPHLTVPATYHPEPRPSLAPPPVVAASAPIPLVSERMDTHAIKQELHDALEEDGLPYWKALNGYLLGQIGRGELEGMVRAWFRGPKLALHNKLLLSLLHNAGSAPRHHAPISPMHQKKRKRVPYDHPEFDMDDVLIEPKGRVAHWVMGMGGRERARVRRAVLGKQMEKEGEVDADGEIEVDDLDQEGGKGKWSSFGASSLIPPLAVPNRCLPSSQQLSLRLSQFAKSHGLSLSPDATSNATGSAAGEIGEFMAVGMDSYLGDVFHGIVHLTGHDRPAGGTIRISPGKGGAGGAKPKLPDSQVNGLTEGEVKAENGKMPTGSGAGAGARSDLPKPDISTLQHLFILKPGLHPQASPALHRLSTSHTQGEIEATRPKSLKLDRDNSHPHSRESTMTNGVAGAATATAGRAETVSQKLLATGLLKLDKAGRADDGEKKERKHNLHWKYEDPALILRDVLG